MAYLTQSLDNFHAWWARPWHAEDVVGHYHNNY